MKNFIDRRTAIKFFLGWFAIFIPNVSLFGITESPTALDGLLSEMRSRLRRQGVQLPPGQETRNRALVNQLRADSAGLDGESLRAFLSEKIRADFAAGRVETLDGWLCSQTECEILLSLNSYKR